MVLALLSMSPTAQAVVVFVVTPLVVKCILWLLSYRSYFKFFMNLPGETDFSWVWGNLHKIRHMNTAQILEYYDKLTSLYPKFYRVWMGPFWASVSFNHPDSVRDLLKSSEPKPVMYRFLAPWLGEGLLVAGGDKYARSRHLLSPAFRFDILKPYVEDNNRACDILMSKLQKHADEKKSMEMFDSISLCTLDIILRCAMSYTDDIQTQGESHPYVHAVTELTELLLERVSNPLVYSDVIYGMTKNGRRFKEQCDFVHSISERVIMERQQSLDRDGPPKKRYLDFLDILLTARDDAGKGLTPLEIRNEVDTFLFAGHDTTASVTSWILHSLCEHPEYQHKVQQEIDAVLKGRESDDLQWGDLSKLEYLAMVIKEGLRRHPPVPFISRYLTKPLTVEGVTLPVGTVCTINIMNVHHNSLVWPDPWTFRPDRFHPDLTKDMDTCAFIPFSGGPRSCIGQQFALIEEKVLLSRLLRRYTFSLDPEHPVKKRLAGVMRTETGMRMFATPRTPTC